jgi:REP element-mobilizing transposase RayT
MFRYWLLTWRTYGTWLPGDQRGFVSPILAPDGRRVIHNTPGEPIDADVPSLRRYSRTVMKGSPILLKPEHAAELFSQFRETAHYRGWELLALAILSNHVHMVVRVAGDPEGADIIRDFKSYASRRLNRVWGPPRNGSWWSESGSRRVLKREEHLRAAIQYVAEQQGALLIWVRSGERPAGERPAGERPA